ncbi:hypothetical protein R9C00_06705 [Flammeovirgaceae bacterium SG7u.111]|nr:hypothetical protein [Flammeovirgaceae bacterium SG7u.132]WPO37132.1 hypothetical protein R9C00_06705 [Flammeovirgaceae bacterium SG7u.111]
MNPKELISKIDNLEQILPKETNQWSSYLCQSFYITSLQFIKNYIGTDTEFYLSLTEYRSSSVHTEQAWAAKKTLKAIKDYRATPLGSIIISKCSMSKHLLSISLD